MARPNPRTAQIAVAQMTDAEIRRVARLASQEAQRIINTSSTVRGAQAQLAAMNVEMWAGVGDAVRDGIEDAAVRSAHIQALFDNDLFKRAGISQPYWRQSLEATARQGIQSLISRRENGYTLSERIWRNSQASRRGLQQVIDVGLALGKSPQEIARDVRKYVSPSVPGGPSSAALRLGRTEVLNAYHRSSTRRYEQTPWIDRAKWNLSGSHPRPDECNEYAEGGNLKDGLWSVDQIPAKPHPNCLCYVTPVPPSLDEYARRYEAGEFDDYINAQMSHAGMAA